MISYENIPWSELTPEQRAIRELEEKDERTRWELSDWYRQEMEEKYEARRKYQHEHRSV